MSAGFRSNYFEDIRSHEWIMALKYGNIKWKMEDSTPIRSTLIQFSSVQKNEELLIRGRGLAVLP